MSYGRVYHVGCPGEFLYDLARRLYVCNKCGQTWDGMGATSKGVVEYREQTEQGNNR